MTEKELIEIQIAHLQGQIKVLQSKLEFYKELERTKTPCEEAFKRIYKVYPSSTEKSVFWTDTDEVTRIAFQKGYEQSQKDYKVGEFQETAQELKTLYQMLDDGKYYPDRRDNICNIVKEWIFQYDCDYATCKEYLEGYEECQTVLEERLK